MWLCSRSWKLLTISDKDGPPFAFSGVLALLECCDVQRPARRLAPCIAEMYIRENRLELKQLLNLDRAGILHLGDRR